MAPNRESRFGLPNLEQEKNVYEITPEFLLQAFSSEEFHDPLRVSLQRYLKKRKGEEFGFEVMKTMNSDDLYIGKVVGGQDDFSTDLHKSTDAIVKKLRGKGADPYTFATFHLHPHYEDDPVIIPSGINGDLGRSNGVRRSTEGLLEYMGLPSIDFIGAVRGDKSLKVLVFREPPSFDPGKYREAFDEMDEAMNYAQSQEDVVHLLKQLKYEADLLNANSDGKFDKQELQKLEKFAYTAKKTS